MSHSSNEELSLTQGALRLIELDRFIVKSIIEWKLDSIAEGVSEFTEIRGILQRALLANPLHQIPGSIDAAARKVLQKIAAGELLPVEKALSNGSLSGVLDTEFTDDDFEEIGRDELYSWMNHVDYAQGLVQAGALVVASGGVPGRLVLFVGEARQCFAFQQYNAVSALCRTMLEIATRDIAISCGILPRDDENVAHMASRGRPPQGLSLAEVITRITNRDGFSHLRDPMHQVRQATNAIIHGTRSVTREEAAGTLKESLRAVHLLYEAWSNESGEAPAG